MAAEKLRTGGRRSSARLGSARARMSFSMKYRLAATAKPAAIPAEAKIPERTEAYQQQRQSELCPALDDAIDKESLACLLECDEYRVGEEIPGSTALSTTKPIAYQGFCRMKSSSRRQHRQPEDVPVATITAAPAHSVSLASICASRSSAVGRNRDERAVEAEQAHVGDQRGRRDAERSPRRFCWHRTSGHSAARTESRAGSSLRLTAQDSWSSQHRICSQVPDIALYPYAWRIRVTLAALGGALTNGSTLCVTGRRRRRTPDRAKQAMPKFFREARMRSA